MNLNIDSSTHRDILIKCLSLYESVRDKRYTETRPKLKLVEIQKDDDWRYNDLPGEAEQTASLSKSQLARLVKWKM